MKAEKNMDTYAQWTVDLWMGNGPLTEKDFTVMSLGLGGEMAEVMEAIEAYSFNSPIDKEWVTKEMGDVIYYWARLNEAFSLSSNIILEKMWKEKGISKPFPIPVNTLSKAFRETSIQSNSGSLPDILRQTLKLGVKVGVVQEIMKKRVRDDVFLEEKFTHAMGEVGVEWLCLCEALDLKPSSVLAANIKKVEDRKLRGVMRGSGNNR